MNGVTTMLTGIPVASTVATPSTEKRQLCRLFRRCSSKNVTRFAGVKRPGTFAPVAAGGAEESGVPMRRKRRDQDPPSCFATRAWNVANSTRPVSHCVAIHSALRNARGE